MKKILWMLALVATTLSACMTEEDADNVVLFATPSATEVLGGQKIYFDILAETRNTTLALFKVESFDNISGQKELFSTEPATQRWQYRYVYDVPNIAVESLDIELIFTAVDNLGNRQTISRTIHVTTTAAELTELTGVALYSPLSGKDDAFSFRLLQRVNSSKAEDADVDIYVDADELSPETLARSWGSKTGLRFAKVNSFNYAAASRQSLEVVYANTVTKTNITDLDIDDIILVGYDSKAVAAVRIVNIYDAEGSEYDRYDISIKCIGALPEGDGDDDTEEDNGGTEEL